MTSRATLATLLAATTLACSATDTPSPPPSTTSPNENEGLESRPVASSCGASKTGLPRLRRLTRDELRATIDAVFPPIAGAYTASLSVDPVSELGFDNDAELLQVGPQTARELAAVGASVAQAALASLDQLLPCASAADRACAEEFVGRYARRLYRRPLAEGDVAELLALFDEAAATGGFEKGIEFVIRALVQSPHTLYRRAVGVADGDAYELTQHEVASELAYTFLGGPPSEELLAMADAGELGAPERVLEEARALLQQPAAEGPVQKFFASWLGYAGVAGKTKSNAPDFLVLRERMLDETRAFVRHVVTSGGGLGELLTADYTLPAPELAAFYGLPAPDANGFSARPAGYGIGLLAQGALLATFAAPDGSSPTLRGLLVYERLLCRERPEPPDDVPDLPSPQPGAATTRQRYEAQHAVGSCAGCHLSFDPIGFGFEHFDEAGRFRADEFGLPIDASGQIPGAVEPVLQFQSQEELARGLASLRVAHECASGFVSAYAFGTSKEPCLGETSREEFVAGRIGFLEYLASLAAEPHFHRRRLE